MHELIFATGLMGETGPDVLSSSAPELADLRGSRQS
jgi:hypothetical protein